VREMTCI